LIQDYLARISIFAVRKYGPPTSFKYIGAIAERSNQHPNDWKHPDKADNAQ
jgi:hypothetical protein